MTDKIVWSDRIRTGNKYIDLQHQDLIELINELAEGVDRAFSTPEVGEILARLETYVLFHFNTEENLMANNRVSIEHARRHMDAHQAFCQQVEGFKANLQTTQPQAIVDFLVHWLTEHIQHTDQELAKLLEA
jgi:hemerythrin